MAIYHDQRTVYWGNWGIDFMNPQSDQTRNYGVLVGRIAFPMGKRGPCDLPKRDQYKEMCRAWIADGIEPPNMIKENQ